MVGSRGRTSTRELRIRSGRQLRELVAFWTIAAVTSLCLLGAVGSAPAVADTHPFIASFGPDGTSSTQFGKPGAIGLDETNGAVYVADLEADKIFKFDTTGEEQDFSALGSNELAGFSFNPGERGVSEIAVDPTSHNFYVADLGSNSVKAFEASGEPYEFTSLSSNELTGFAEVCGVATDADGDIYVGDFAEVNIFNPDGEELTSFAASGACNVAVDSTGAVYVVYYSGNVEKFTPSESPVTPTTTYTSAGTFDPNTSFGIAIDPTNDDVYVNEETRVAQYNSAGDRLGTSGEAGDGALTGSEGVAIRGSSGLLFASDQSSLQVKRYGPLIKEMPLITQQWVSDVGSSSALLAAEVNPKGSATTYRFEFGIEDCSVSFCETTEELPLGAGGTALRVKTKLANLDAGTTYHFRIVATNEGGTSVAPDQTFKTAGPSGTSAFSLPDGRAFEMVSPPNKNNAEVSVPGPPGGLINGTVKPERASSDGNVAVYASFTAFDNPLGAPAGSYYLSRRTSSGWSSENITPPDETLSLSGPIRGLTEDLSKAGVVATGVPLASGAVSGLPNLYVRNNISGVLQAITTQMPTNIGTGDFCVNYIGASADGSRVILAANGGLTPDSPAPSQPGGINLYEWTSTEGLKLVSIYPDETAAVPNTFAGFGSGFNRCFISNASITRQPISDDGNRSFWTVRPDASEPFFSQLFARIDGSTTVQVDQSQGGPDSGGNGFYLDAARDGSRVLFRGENRLVPGANSNDLYMFDVDAEELTDLTLNAEPAEVQGLVGAADDLSHVYFVARGVLAVGASSGQPNLYLWNEGTVDYIATLAPGIDEGDWSTFYTDQTARVTPDGKHLAFVSAKQLTDYDNRIVGFSSCALSTGGPIGDRGCSEVYTYDSDDSVIRCVSCHPSGANPVGPPLQNTQKVNSLPSWATPFEQPRYFSNDGRRLFFYSTEGLLPRDNNGRRDVYEFERVGTGSCSASSTGFNPSSDGCVFLISTGSSGDDSYFVDASLSGEDAFISTRAPLVPADQDDRFDLYDARVGGGFAEAPTTRQICAGEGCRGAVAGTPATGSSGSESYSGKGNVRSVKKKCRPGKVRRHGRCVKRRRNHQNTGRPQGTRKPSQKGHNRGGAH